MTWGENLKTARERGGLSASLLGQLVARDRATVYRWESDRVRPKLAERRLLARLLDIDVDELFPPNEPALVTAARRVTRARTVVELRSAVDSLREVLSQFDASERTQCQNTP